MPVGICISATYCFLLHSSTKEIFPFKWRLIDDVVGFSTTPGAAEGILTHLLCVIGFLPNGNCVQDVSL